MRIEVTKENLDKLSHKEQVKFSLFCAKQVEHLTTAKEAKVCIEVTERWLRGEASQEECRKAANAVDAYAYDVRGVNAAAYAARAVYASAFATWTAANAADAAARAAVYAAADVADERSNKTKVTKEQEEYLYELINIDLIVEKNLLT